MSTSYRWTSAALILLGVTLFTWGGSQHPPTDASLGPMGSSAYFRAFAMHVAEMETWRVIHAAILAGPLLWSLGAIGLAGEMKPAVDRGSEGFARIGVVALAMGAVAWALVFVLDGFVAPIHAAAVVAGQQPLLAFQVNQEIVIRLGLVSWMLIGAGVAGLSLGLLAAGESGRPRRPGRLALGGAGVLLGLWPLVAWGIGAFRPGPFTSPLWTPTALATALWFLAAAAFLGLKAVRRGGPREPSPGG